MKKKKFKTLYRAFTLPEGDFIAMMEFQKISIIHPSKGWMQMPLYGYFDDEKIKIFYSKVPELIAAKNLSESANLMKRIRNGEDNFYYSEAVSQVIKNKFFEDKNYQFEAFHRETLKGICPQCGERTLIVDYGQNSSITCLRLTKCGWVSNIFDFYPDLFTEEPETGASHADK